MKTSRNAAILFTFLLLAMSASGSLGQIAAGRRVAQPRADVEKYQRVELYFGMSKPDGTSVTEEDWEKFVDEAVTPRIPDFTVLTGNGQFRGDDGRISKERSKVMIILYSRRSRKAVSVKVDEIRADYIKRFSQRSVMRVDLDKPVSVQF